MDRDRLGIYRLTAGLGQFVRNNETRLLRVAMGTVFIWFGGLKILGETSVLGIIQSTYPFLAAPPFLQTLGIAELVLGVTVVSGWHVRLFAGLMALHLAGTLLVPFLAPTVAFDPGFPVLTLQGEFVVKNLVLVSAALLICAKR